MVAVLGHACDRNNGADFACAASVIESAMSSLDILDAKEANSKRAKICDARSAPKCKKSDTANEALRWLGNLNVVTGSRCTESSTKGAVLAHAKDRKEIEDFK